MHTRKLRDRNAGRAVENGYGLGAGQERPHDQIPTARILVHAQIGKGIALVARQDGGNPSGIAELRRLKRPIATRLGFQGPVHRFFQLRYHETGNAPGFAHPKIAEIPEALPLQELHEIILQHLPEL